MDVKEKSNVNLHFHVSIFGCLFPIFRGLRFRRRGGGFTVFATTDLTA